MSLLEAKNERGMTAMLIACAAGHKKMVEALFRKGASALYRATVCRLLDVVAVGAIPYVQWPRALPIRF